jgi:class 3 adenylate cyclase
MAADSCSSCGTELLVNAKFCHACGSPIQPSGDRAEYKQVTVLFTDVVRSMAIASAVDVERLREIMAELFTRSAAVVQRYGGTVDKFTGDGIMALFGAPIALEDHAVRACRAALEIQDAARELAREVERTDGVDLEIRVGLNSGRVIAGEIASGAAGYTAVGEQVGLAQRMESVAPAGGVMLMRVDRASRSTCSRLGRFRTRAIKGAASAVPARRLIGMAAQPMHAPR